MAASRHPARPVPPGPWQTGATVPNPALPTPTMLAPRAIPAFAPAFDRQVLRAALARGGPWPREPAALASEVCEAFGRAPGRWSAAPEAAVLMELATLRPGLVLAAPAFGRPPWAGPLAGVEVIWMDPAHGRVDPGISEVAAALQAGANAVLLTPVAGDPSALPEISELCRRKGVPLALDSRASHGSRALDRCPEQLGDITVLAPHGEPDPSPCPGAILAGVAPEATGAGPRELRWALTCLRRSLSDEPRLARWTGRVEPGSWSPPPAAPPRWALAAASARLRQASGRADQRAWHARDFRVNTSNIPAVDVLPDARGCVSAGAVVATLARQRDEVAALLIAAGLPPVPGCAALLAPGGSRSEHATRVSERFLAIPLHPFLRPADKARLAEGLRTASLRANGDGWADPSDGYVQGS